MNQLIISIFLLSAPSLLYSMSDTIEAKVWCPEGTWWSYKMKFTPWLKDKDHEIFIYEKDTFILNKVAKKINVFYMQTEWSIQPDGSLLDSAIYGPLYMSSIFLYNSNDSIYGLGKLPTLKNYNREFTKFHFLYKVNNEKGEKIAYTKPLLSDSIDCYNLKDIYFSDTLYTDSIINVKYTNRVNKLVNLDVIYNHFIGLKFYGYNQVYKNGTLEKDGLMYDYKVGEELYKKYIDSCKKLNISFSSNNDLYSLLNCYKQGSTGYIVDRYSAKEGCEFLYKLLQKNSLLQVKDLSKQENIIRVTDINNSRIRIFQTSTQLIKIKVYNLLGKLILEKNSNLQEDEIVFPQNIQSIYILNIYNLENEIIYSNKIIIL